MALKDFKKVDFKDKNMTKFQENITEYFAQFNNVLLSGRIVSGIQIETSTTNVNHLLGRKFNGWHLLDIQGDARVWRDTTTSADLTKFLPLKASSIVTVSLWVF